MSVCHVYTEDLWSRQESFFLFPGSRFVYGFSESISTDFDVRVLTRIEKTDRQERDFGLRHVRNG